MAHLLISESINHGLGNIGKSLEGYYGLETLPYSATIIANLGEWTWYHLLTCLQGVALHLR